MRMQSQKESASQFDLLPLDASSQAAVPDGAAVARAERVEPKPLPSKKSATRGAPLLVAVRSIDEDPNNPRTEFPDAEIDELADDIRQRGILQPLVVHPADAQGRFTLHFGAKRLRAALRAGLSEVPVVVRAAPADAYGQVAENQKRHALTPLDLARFIKGRVDAGEPNAEIARRLGMDLTSVAHHLALLELPPVLGEAMTSGRCTSPRTLYELRKLHAAKPEAVESAVAGVGALTRAVVNALKANAGLAPRTERGAVLGKAKDTLDQIERLCGRLEEAMQTALAARPAVDAGRLAAIRARLAKIADACNPGSDGPTLPAKDADGQG